MEVLFELNDSFLKFDMTNQKVVLEPGIFDDVGVYTDSKIRFGIAEYPLLTLTVTIEATVLECSVVKSSFAQ